MCILNWITVGTFIISIITLIQNTIRSLKERIEQKKALICASVFECSSGKWNMTVSNIGQATAKNIRYSPDTGDYISPVIVDKGPYDLLNSQENFTVRILMPEEAQDIITVKFLWDDDYKINNGRTQIISFQSFSSSYALVCEESNN